MIPAYGASAWEDALLVARLFAVNPQGLGGVTVRSPPSPVRNLWLEYLYGLLAPGAPVRRLPAGIADERLLGGIDLTATLAVGRPVLQRGVLAEADQGIVVIPMAERLSLSTAARIAAVLDRGLVAIEREGIGTSIPTSLGVVALDEGHAPEERLPSALAGRFAFLIDLQGISFRGLEVPKDEAARIAEARACLGALGPVGKQWIEALVKTALGLGIGSVMAPLLALRVARASAALAGRDGVDRDDVVLAARLVLAPLATTMPDPDVEEPSPDPQDQDTQSDPQEGSESEQAPQSLDEMISEAVQANLPPGLLECLKNATADRSVSSARDGAGSSQPSFLRGRPAGTRMGQIRNGARLALVDTLRAAAPWQRVRRAQRGAASGSRLIEVRKEDFRIRKFARRRESSILFCVDASGSAAFHRLAEAKGAVELLLGEAYVARTYAGLVAFRGTSAEVLLPPSRSLTRAKALLSTLPGGGGTPLAAGIEATTRIAIAERAKGRQPLIVILTDGQANIARDGKSARSEAFADALLAARAVAAHAIAAVFIDTAPRAREEGRKLAEAMQARYLPLPHCEAHAVRDFVRASAP